MSFIPFLLVLIIVIFSTYFSYVSRASDLTKYSSSNSQSSLGSNTEIDPTLSLTSFLVQQAAALAANENNAPTMSSSTSHMGSHEINNRPGGGHVLTSNHSRPTIAGTATANIGGGSNFVSQSSSALQYHESGLPLNQQQLNTNNNSNSNLNANLHPLHRQFGASDSRGRMDLTCSAGQSEHLKKLRCLAPQAAGLQAYAI
jgi:hypothetical protein